MADPFERAHAPPIGVAERLAPGLRVVTAPNAGPMTFTGTRSYIVGEGEVAVIDPGPADARHLEALAAAVAGERVAAVLVTHAHRDHSAGARGLRGAGRQRRCWRMATRWGRARRRWRGWRRRGASAAARGWTRASGPTGASARATRWRAPGGRLTAVATPGHTADHLAFAWAEGDALFTGDHGDGLGDDDDLAAGRRSRRLPRQPGAAAAAGRGGLLSRPRGAGGRAGAGGGAYPGAPGGARGGDPGGARPGAGDGGGAGGGGLRRHRPGGCAGRRGATCWRISSISPSAGWRPRRGRSRPGRASRGREPAVDAAEDGVDAAISGAGWSGASRSVR